MATIALDSGLVVLLLLSCVPTASCLMTCGLLSVVIQETRTLPLGVVSRDDGDCCFIFDWTEKQSDAVSRFYIKVVNMTASESVFWEVAQQAFSKLLSEHCKDYNIIVDNPFCIPIH